MTLSLFTTILEKIFKTNFSKMKSETFGELIRRLRKEKGMPLRELSAGIEMDQSLMSKIERNKLVAPQRVIRKMAEALDVDYAFLQKKYLADRLYHELKEVDYSLEVLQVVKNRLEKERKGTSFEVKREQLIKNLKQFFKGQPVDKVWVFGSFAREEESLDSDLDLLVRFIQPNKLDLFEYIGIRQELEDLTGRQIDLVEEGQELERIRSVIDKEKKLIYER